MNIFPSQEQFGDWVRTCERVPILGEECVPDLCPALLYRRLFGNSSDSFLFESGKGPAATARYTMMGKSNSRFIKIQNGKSLYTDTKNGKIVSGNPCEGFERLGFVNGNESSETLPHFWGGWVGYIGYEMAEYFEELPNRKETDLEGLPDLHFMQVDHLLVYDHAKQILKYIISVESDTPPYDHYVREIEEAWQGIHQALIDIKTENPPNPETSNLLEKVKLNGLHSNLTQGEYMECVSRAKAYIAEGDIYQANLSQRFETDFEGDPFDLYMRLRKVNPSPFSGYLKLEDCTIVSSSPERLLKVENDQLETRPIAGTRPRGKTSAEDRSLASELLLNEKEKAEHLMLVDLERNDMGRICMPGSVKVTDLMFLEQYSHVNHIVSNITGKLNPGTGIEDILRAVFPGGTITGCPKVRCMEIINELEPTPRGPYSGSFGYIGFSRHMDFNIIIRTIILKDGKAYFNVGAGIVADSDPEKEYQETLDKAAAMMEALGMGEKS